MDLKNINRITIIKFVELVLIITCVGLHADSFNITSDIGMLVTGTFVGYLIIVVGVIAGHLLKTPMHKNVDIYFSLVGLVLFVSSGAVVIDRFQGGNNNYARKNLAKGSLSIITAAVLLVDAALTHRES